MASRSDSDREEDVVMGSGSDSEGEENAAHGDGSNVDDKSDSKSHRGPTVKAKANRKTLITYNKRGVPTGPGARKLSTFEGLVARSMVLITYDSWLNVDNETKEACWEYVKTHFKLHQKSRKQVLQSIGIKWKNFKHYLYKKYIKPLKDDNSKEAKKLLYTPPERYPSVKKKDWKLFVSQRTKSSFEEKSQKASAIRSRNKYNHRLSRKGYAGLISEIMQETGKEEEDIDRVECWKRAREKKKGGFDQDVQKVLDKIEMLKKDVDFSEDPLGSLDLLTEALGTEEQRGRVRGMGRFVTHQQYFLIPKNVKQYLKQHDKKMNKRLKAVEDELQIRKCATYASEGASNCRMSSSSDEEEEEEEPDVPNEPTDKSCYLAVDEPSNIVAKGTIVNQTLSDVNIEVKVDTSVQPEASIPIPIPDEFVETVKDAIGYLLSWPSHLVIPCSGLNKIVAKKKDKKAADDKEKRRKEQRKEQRKEEETKEEEVSKEEEEKDLDVKEKETDNKKKEKTKRQREPDNEEEEPRMSKTVAVEQAKSPETVGSVAKVKGTPLKKMMTRAQKRGRKRVEQRMGLKMAAVMVDGQVAKVDSIKVQSEDELFGHPSYTYLNWNDFDKLFTTRNRAILDPLFMTHAER